MSLYNMQEAQAVLDAGPYPDENWFRIQVRGNTVSKWLNITPTQLRLIAAILGADSEAPEMDIAYNYPASDEAAAKVMSKPANDGEAYDDDRSGWRWLRLTNGDLMLGVFPHGGTYLEVEDDVAADWTAALNTDKYTVATLDVTSITEQFLTHQRT